MKFSHLKKIKRSGKNSALKRISFPVNKLLTILKYYAVLTH